MIGVVDNLGFDILAHHGAAFRECAPELELLRPGEVTDPAAVEFVLTFRPPDDCFARYPNLRAAVSPAAGMDGILACPSLPPGLPVLRVEDPDQARQMAGFAVFHVLWHHRRIDLHLEDQRAERWNRPAHGRSPQSRRIGIMGHGNMGRAIAQALAGLGYPVRVLARRPAEAAPGVEIMLDRDAFLSGTDILINVLPLTAETRGVIDAALLARLPEGAALIQIGRGEQLVEADLLAALDGGRLAGASLDVFAVEPLPAGHPFWRHPRVLVTPHTASAPESRNVALCVSRGLAALRDGMEATA
ncbi:2-hydroxyacid dehydrogenase [Mangrovicoccus algicola]|uniref:Glyoxylate/hydroxypyruvate reductase A n=1 Tax=Mangrovicoccus algicola TaxID=2771008 RepID=A0A8J6YXH9_9RHOB|nr:glyoxylate/hydroxypyruvate reductase A [Mangrovicoccus algicola]MBE3639617.1 glyoxylate/hydroxypyruvate reductase A [Mangrovicoccus algicola]